MLGVDIATKDAIAEYALNTPIHLGFEFYCLISQRFIYITHVIEDTVILDIGVIYLIESETRMLNIGLDYSGSFTCISLTPIESISIGDSIVYYKLFDRLSIIDGTSCRAVIETISSLIKNEA